MSTRNTVPQELRKLTRYVDPLGVRVASTRGTAAPRAVDRGTPLMQSLASQKQRAYVRVANTRPAAAPASKSAASSTAHPRLSSLPHTNRAPHHMAAGPADVRSSRRFAGGGGGKAAKSRAAGAEARSKAQAKAKARTSGRNSNKSC